MDYQSVNSSNISHIGYDDATGTLGVRFKGSGKEYHYPGVPRDKFSELASAPSVGSHFAKYIRGTYTGTPV